MMNNRLPDLLLATVHPLLATLGTVRTSTKVPTTAAGFDRFSQNTFISSAGRQPRGVVDEVSVVA